MNKFSRLHDLNQIWMLLFLNESWLYFLLRFRHSILVFYFSLFSINFVDNFKKSHEEKYPKIPENEKQEFFQAAFHFFFVAVSYAIPQKYCVKIKEKKTFTFCGCCGRRRISRQFFFLLFLKRDCCWRSVTANNISKMRENLQIKSTAFSYIHCLIIGFLLTSSFQLLFNLYIFSFFFIFFLIIFEACLYLLMICISWLGIN